jgi:plastocyanin
MKKNTLKIGLIGLLTAVLFSCSKSSLSDDDQTTSTSTTVSSSDVAIKSTGFAPAEKLIGKEIVTWVNTDSKPHTVTAKDGSFDALVQPGASFSYNFSRVGVYEYYDKLTLATGVVTVHGRDDPL